MNNFKVLVEGYAHPGKNGKYIASPTTTLVESDGIMFLVDPGANRKKLLNALKKESITAKDLSFVYLTHYHPDHLLNINLFPEIPVYDGELCWKNDVEIPHEGKLPGIEIEILKTPGHSQEHTSLMLKTEIGVVCIAADVFWWEDGEQKTGTKKELLDLHDPFVVNKKELLKSRKLVLSKADYIIPGHGKMFKVPEKTS